jgi:hypothetical protein
VPQCVVFNDELRGDRRAEAQREGRRPIQLVIRERARTAAAASRLFRRKSSSPAAFVTPAYSWACLAFNSATTSHVTSVTASPLATVRARSISIG